MPDASPPMPAKSAPLSPGALPDIVDGRGATEERTPPPSLHHSETIFWNTQAVSSSSPLKRRDTIMTNRGDRDGNEEHRDAMLKELGSIYTVDLEDLKRVLRPLAADREISSFFQNTDVYQDGRWSSEGLPFFASKEKELYQPLVTIIGRIIGHFYPSDSLPPGVQRKVVDTHKMHLAHDDQGDWTLPDISIQASGPSFEVPTSSAGRRNKTIGYTNVAAVIDAKKEESLTSDSPDLHVAQAGIYCRQIYLQQPNREFVRSLILTERRCRFMHYDRSGVYVSPLFDIHSMEGRELFVLCVLSVSSPNEAALGFDTSVQWDIDDAGRKVSGRISTFDKERNAMMEYRLNMAQAVFVRPGVRSRGTVGWSAWHPVTGEGVLIKDSWRTHTRDPEWEWLNTAQGIAGIPKLFGFKDFLAQTQSFRPAPFGPKRPKIAYPGFYNRIKSRVVLKKYGPCLWNFRSRLQFVKAVRGAIIAHRDLYVSRMILHRDIAVPNILLPLQTEGDMPPGILVDFDMAIPAWRELNEGCTTDPRSAYRFYLSIANVLGIQGNDSDQAWVPPHNYTDELEAFFYVTVHVMYYFKRPGVNNEVLDSLLQDFRREDDKLVVKTKRFLFLTPPDIGTLSTYWHGACSKLLTDFHAVIKEMVEAAHNIRLKHVSNGHKTMELREYAIENVQSHYDRIVAAFDTAIEELTKEGLNSEELEPYPENPAPYPLYRNPPGTPTTKPALHSQSQLGQPSTPKASNSSIKGLQAHLRANRESRKRESEDHDLDSENKKRVRVLLETSRSREPQHSSSSKAAGEGTVRRNPAGDD